MPEQKQLVMKLKCYHHSQVFLVETCRVLVFFSNLWMEVISSKMKFLFQKTKQAPV